jgi:hypothetical protein
MGMNATESEADVDVMARVRDLSAQAAIKHPDPEKAIAYVKSRLGDSGWKYFADRNADELLNRIVLGYIYSARNRLRENGITVARDGQLAAKEASISRARFAARVEEAGLMETWFVGDRRLGD